MSRYESVVYGVLEYWEGEGPPIKLHHLQFYAAMVWPPSTTSALPVTNDASSEARKSTP